MSFFKFVVLLVYVGPAIAFAQGPLVEGPSRPFQGVYRGDQRDLQSPQALVLSLGITESYDGNIIAAESALSPTSTPTRSGFYTRASTGLFYSRRHRAAQFVANGGAGFDYYPQFGSEVKQPLNSYHGTAGVALQMGRNNLRASQSVARQPYFAFDLSQSIINPDAALVATNGVSLTPDVALLTEPMVVYNTSVSLTAPIGRRTSLDASYGYAGSNPSQRWTTVKTQALGIRLNRAVLSTLSVHGSYNYQLAVFRSPFFATGDIGVQDAEAGFKYTKPLSRTRAITLSAGAGASMLNDQSVPMVQTGTVSGLSSNAEFTLQFARSWSTNLGIRRSLLLLQGLARPYYGNALSFGLRGEPSDRFDISAEGYMLRSDPATDAAFQAYDTFTAAARIRYALSRNMALSGEYLHYEYNFGANTQLPVGVFRTLDRDVARFGVSFALPLIGRQ